MSEVETFEVETDRRDERLWIHLLPRLPGLEFWSVENSDRCWAMHHDTFTASLVLAPERSLCAGWRYRGRDQVVTPGHLQLMEPGETHQTTFVSHPASFFVVFFQPEVMAEAALRLGLRAPLHFGQSQLEDAGLRHAFERVQANLRACDAPLAVDYWVSEAVARLIECCAERGLPLQALGAAHPGVRRAHSYLREHFAETVSLDALAREARTSKYHLARSFTDAFGIPPHRYQRLLRVAAAKRRIVAGESLKEVAAMTGFADHAHLTRVFRAALGLSPSAWSRVCRARRSFSMTKPPGRT